MSPLRRLALTLSLSLTGAGCATVGGHRQYVSVDSSVRGLEVADAAQPDKTLGVTPFFHDSRRAPGHDYLVRGPDGSTRPHHSQCAYRWAGSTLANVPAAAAAVLGPWWGVGALLAANGTDLATGAAWDCPPVRLDGEFAAARLKPPCPVLLPLPPLHADPKASARIADAWKAQMRERGGCALVADTAAVNDLLLAMEVDHGSALDLTQADPQRLAELGHRSGASHLVELRHSVEGQQLMVMPVTHDLHTGFEDRDTPFSLDIGKEPFLAPSPLRRAALATLNFLPNSIAFAVGMKAAQFAAQPGWKLLDGPVPSSLPAAMDSLTVEWVEPPHKHRTWDFIGAVSPKVSVGYVSRRFTLTDPEGASSTNDMRMLQTLLLLAAKGQLYTPVGVLGLQLGAGGGGAWAMGAGVPEGAVAAGAGWFGLAHADYTLFPTRSLFVSLGYDLYVSPGPYLQTSGWSVSGLQMGSVTVGWFLPEIKGWASQLF